MIAAKRCSENWNPAPVVRWIAYPGIGDQIGSFDHAASLPPSQGIVNPRHVSGLRHSIFPPPRHPGYTRGMGIFLAVLGTALAAFCIWTYVATPDIPSSSNCTAVVSA